uniref:Fibronectin type III domain-containing protein n=1 Tax=Candidatus Kentrum sp. FM TaxID=2126340 RepID=A0A450W1P3_9GAMM|nr:MAG: Fibronectin type III domain-containing protein [Candidatus Kentron sp. FM]VFJ55785.1 MAG: Fibronectin type III domain-containing protein [Candidatus Kentron sp. FM]VFK10971.1 MAG: Fibronectin type III domain-containing protein [Candidatus Kentron sp. FM]
MSSKFPSSESKLLNLAREMAAGFTANAEVYPAPPVNAADVDLLITGYVGAKEGVAEARAQVSRAQESKEEAIEALRGAVKRNLRYAENTVNYDDGKLQLIGWSGRRPPSAPQPPGQVLDLTSPNRGDGWIELEWKAPGDGGKVVAYRVQRREVGQDAWANIDTALVTSARLENQESGKKFEFCVVAMNKAGDGQLSNEITATL